MGRFYQITIDNWYYVTQLTYTHVLTHQLSVLDTEFLTFTLCYVVISYHHISHSIAQCHMTWIKSQHASQQTTTYNPYFYIFTLHSLPFFSFSYCLFLNIRNYLTVCMWTLWTLTRKRALPPLLPQTNCTYMYMHIYRDWETDHPEVVRRKTVLIIIVWRKVLATKRWKVMIFVKK